MHFIHHHSSLWNKSNAHLSSFGSSHSLSSSSLPCTVVHPSAKRSLLIDSVTIKSQSRIYFLPLTIGSTSSNGSSNGNPAVPISIPSLIPASSQLFKITFFSRNDVISSYSFMIHPACSGFKTERFIFTSISSGGALPLSRASQIFVANHLANILFMNDFA